MQLPRVVIAAVFLVIGALIAVPALMKSSGSGARASSTTSTSASPSPSGSGASPSPSGTSTAHKPAKSPSANPSHPAAGQPVTADIGAVACPSRSVRVTIRNTGAQREDYTIVKDDDTATVPGTVGPRDRKSVTVELKEDRRTRVEVTWANKQIESRTLKANCKHAGAAPHKTTPNKLPHTGPDTVLWARAATGVGVMLTGAVIFWYGGIWPRRREQIFAKKGE